MWIKQQIEDKKAREAKEKFKQDKSLRFENIEKLIILLEGKNAFDDGDYITIIKKQIQLFPSIQFLKLFLYILLFPFKNLLNKLKNF